MVNHLLYMGPLTGGWTQWTVKLIGQDTVKQTHIGKGNAKVILLLTRGHHLLRQAWVEEIQLHRGRWILSEVYRVENAENLASSLATFKW